jgi:uncharacterized protein YkwD
MVRKIVPFVVALALSLPLLAFDAQHHADVRGMSAAALVEAMNRERAAAGLAPLRLNETLSAAADDRMRDMFAKHYFEHVSPDGIDPFTWAEKRGYDYRAIGENLAVGYRRASDVVDGWMHSAGHRENVMGRDFEEIGIAISDAAPKRPFAGPTVVALYGTTANHRKGF